LVTKEILSVLELKASLGKNLITTATDFRVSEDELLKVTRGKRTYFAREIARTRTFGWLLQWS